LSIHYNSIAYSNLKIIAGISEPALNK
jgi:hypothetical protein